MRTWTVTVHILVEPSFARDHHEALILTKPPWCVSMEGFIQDIVLLSLEGGTTRYAVVFRSSIIYKGNKDTA